MRREIFEQPETVARLIDRETTRAFRLGAELRRRQVRFALLAARGTSDHAATVGKYLFGCRLGVAAGLAAPSIVTLYKSRLKLQGALVIGISQSGRSPDIVEVLRQARRSGALTLALTNDASSPLAAAARHTLPLHAGPERSVAATKTFTAQLAGLYLLAAGWQGGRGGEELLAKLREVPEELVDALGLDEDIAARMGHNLALERCVVIGRGFAYPVALETALKLKEAAGAFD